MSKIDDLQRENDPEILEKAQKTAIPLLIQLQETLTRVGHESNDWKQMLERLTGQSKPRIVVAIVGSTGAGKSSVINAILDEERLLPTNCVRACTASAVEIAYNESEDPEAPYRAEVEFISREDWANELEVLIGDIRDAPEGKISSDPAADSEAAIALAKIRAVYPGITHDVIAAEGTGLADRESVQDILGTSVHMKSKKSSDLSKKLKKFIDSKDRAKSYQGRGEGGNSGKNRSSAIAIIDDNDDGQDELAKDDAGEHSGEDAGDDLQPNEVNVEDTTDASDNPKFEHWPLIKVVRIFTKAQALEQGTVLVDLPGVMDNNAGRSAVAETYLKNCDRRWVVAPITRAMDDKTARTLLGETFKRQLKFDGAIDTVSFICSKTDDIIVDEVDHTIGIDPLSLWKKVNELETEFKLLEKRHENLKYQSKDLKKVEKSIDGEVKVWKRLRKALESGKDVFAPAPKREKKRSRKASTTPRRSVRRRSGGDSGRIRDEFGSSSDTEQEDDSVTGEEKQPLTKEQIETKLDELQKAKDSIAEECNKMNKKGREVSRQLADVGTVLDEETAAAMAVCIKARNEYARDAIKNDFATGIRELDQEAAIAQNEQEFDPSKNYRDYDELARQLSVFCVSSRVYQQLNGRFKKDTNPTDGFENPRDTEIPLLQEQARRLTQGPRVEAARNFFNEFQQLTQSVNLWASAPPRLQEIDALLKKKRSDTLFDALEKIRSDITEVTNCCISRVKNILESPLGSAMKIFAPVAEAKALEIARGWGAPGSQEGLRWATYKAACRRNGSYKSKRTGVQDWNADLARPLQVPLAGTWETVFAILIPSEIARFAREFDALIGAFHDRVAARPADLWGPDYAPAFANLSKQLVSRRTGARNIPGLAGRSVKCMQQDASREFKLRIGKTIEPAYKECANESGKGSFARMKQCFIETIQKKKGTMYYEVISHISTRLEELHKELGKDLERRTTKIVNGLSHDYRMALLHRSNPETWKVEQKQKDEILGLIRTIGAAFQDHPVKDDAPCHEAFDGVMIKLEPPSF